jgi:propionyl-CoA carboxylase alpha chain/3-methylcrotonyl-CoA carboxylase alpha subunit/acetyl-CoA/propionyl-CoA carboxylase biotin carboxyl carrier protein
MITGLDLVRLQIEIAAGRDLPFAQDEVTANGHAIECRICAEDPERDFLPETGTILHLGAPQAAHLRFENALDRGQRITADFDPMLAKLVAHGPDRAGATRRSIAALHDLALLGVKTNIDYLARVLGHPAFAAGELHTGFVSQHKAALAAAEPAEATRDRVLIAAALGLRDFRDLVLGVPEPHASIGHWRN